MQPADYTFELPEALIAQVPLPERAASRLLHLTPAGELEDLQFKDFSRLVNPGDLLVLNDTRVVPARLLGRKATGGKVEILLERELEPDLAVVQLRASKTPPDGSRIEIADAFGATVTGRQGNFFVLRFDAPVQDILDAHGHVPLPPYIKREDDDQDRERYQTVFAREPGAVAAPTAGLHFDKGQLNRLRSIGVELGYLTLHVGAGTFQPLREDQLTRGELHAERLQVSERLCRQVADTRELGGRVIAVGTTVVRGLETAAAGGELQPCDSDTRLFIRPGYAFRVVDALLTNFHLPESSLLMLVSAFAGTAAVKAAYAHAVAERYRFFSYGDAMFCHRAAA
ncbi:MAG: tRNA preQ1(34) S-adenosylmethionine ribosyltransferase-isomerase QueA [Chromatiales bacterium]|nr:MAG: tRNA preQ1(34) S-adenosylmethionine ribosyltransferase-isomerase QueA [Chromatiales bacterium]